MLKNTQEKYRDLIVRVASYGAFFVELCKVCSDDYFSNAVLTQL